MTNYQQYHTIVIGVTYISEVCPHHRSIMAIYLLRQWQHYAPLPINKHCGAGDEICQAEQVNIMNADGNLRPKGFSANMIWFLCNILIYDNFQRHKQDYGCKSIHPTI